MCHTTLSKRRSRSNNHHHHPSDFRCLVLLYAETGKKPHRREKGMQDKVVSFQDFGYHTSLNGSRCARENLGNDLFPAKRPFRNGFLLVVGRVLPTSLPIVYGFWGWGISKEWPDELCSVRNISREGEKGKQPHQTSQDQARHWASKQPAF